jgi:hypothetical protein
MYGAARVALLGAVLAVLLAGAFLFTRPHPRIAARVAAMQTNYAAATPATSAGSLIDPLSPERAITVDTAARPKAGDWVKARPDFQYSHSAADRGGVEPCATQRVDTSGFEDWTPLARGKLTTPRAPFLDGTGRFDLVIHLHGDEPVRRELVLSKQHFVLFTLTLDPSQSYAPLFTGSRLYEAIVAGVEKLVAERTGKAAHVGHVALSAWSAGFVGIEAALAQPVSKDVDAVLLIDGLHAPRNDDPAFKAQLAPFVAYAARAAAGERFMLVSHSSIDPPDFASTTECAHYLVASLGGKPQPVKRADALGLELVEYFNRGDLNVRGYAGNDKADHCAQLGVLRDAFAALGRRWSSKPAE